MSNFCVNKGSKEYKKAISVLGTDEAVQSFASIFPNYELPTGIHLERALKIYTAQNKGYQNVLNESQAQLHKSLTDAFNLNPQNIADAIDVFNQIIKLRSQQGAIDKTDLKYALQSALNEIRRIDESLHGISPSMNAKFSATFNNFLLSYFDIKNFNETKDIVSKEKLDENFEEEKETDEEEQLTAAEFGNKLFDADVTAEFAKKVTHVLKNIDGMPFREAEKAFISFIRSSLFDPKYPYKSIENIKEPLLRERLLSLPHHLVTSVVQYYSSLRPSKSLRIIKGDSGLFFQVENIKKRKADISKDLEKKVFDNKEKIANQENYKEISSNAGKNIPQLRKNVISLAKNNSLKNITASINKEIKNLSDGKPTKYSSISELIKAEGNEDLFAAIQAALLLQEEQISYVSSLSGLSKDELRVYFNELNNDTAAKTAGVKNQATEKYFSDANEFNIVFSVLKFPGNYSEANSRNLNSPGYYYMALKRDEATKSIRPKTYNEFFEDILKRGKSNTISKTINAIANQLTKNDLEEFSPDFRNAKGSKAVTNNLHSALQIQAEIYLNDSSVVNNEKFKDNDYVQINKFKPQEEVLIRVGGLKNINTNEGVDNGDVRADEFVTIQTLSFARPQAELVSEGQYLNVLEVFSDKKPVILTPVKRYTKAEALAIIKKEIPDIDDKNSQNYKVFQEDIVTTLKDIDNLINIGALPSIIVTQNKENVKPNTLQFVELMLLNYAANKLQTDAFYNNSGEMFKGNYKKMVKRSNVSPQMALNYHIEGGIGPVVNHITIPDPTYSVSKVIEEVTGVKLPDGDGADGFQIIIDKDNEKFNMSGGSAFDVGGNMKLFYNNNNPLTNERKMLKSNTIVLTKAEAIKSPLLNDIYNLIESNSKGKTTILSFASSAKVNPGKFGNTENVIYEKDKNGDTRLVVKNEIVTDELDSRFLGILNDLRQEAVLKSGKTPSQALRKWEALKGGEKITEALAEIAKEERIALMNEIAATGIEDKEKRKEILSSKIAISPTEQQIKNYILKEIDDTDPQNKLLIDLLKNTNVKFSDPKVSNQINNFISNRIQKRILDIKSRKAVPTEKPNINNDLKGVEKRGPVATAAEIRLSEELKSSGVQLASEEFPEYVINEKGDTIDINIVNYALKKAFDLMKNASPENIKKAKNNAVDLAIKTMKDLEPSYPEDKTRKATIREAIANKLSYAVKASEDVLNDDFFNENIHIKPKNSYTTIIRVPVTENHSISYMKVVGWIPKGTGSAVIETDFTTAKMAGADNDGDGRHMIFRSTSKNAKDKLMNNILDVVQNNYADSSMLSKLMDPINPNQTFEAFGKTEKDFDKSSKIDRIRLVKAKEAISSNRAGKDNIGIAANFLSFANYSMIHKFELNNPVTIQLGNKEIVIDKLYGNTEKDNVAIGRNLANVANESVDNANRQMLSELGIDVSNNVLYNILVLAGFGNDVIALKEYMNSPIVKAYRDLYLSMKNPLKSENYSKKSAYNILKEQLLSGLEKEDRKKYSKIIEQPVLPGDINNEKSLESKLRALGQLKKLMDIESDVKDIITLIKLNESSIDSYAKYKRSIEVYNKVKKGLPNINVKQIISDKAFARAEQQIITAKMVYGNHILETNVGKKLLEFYKELKAISIGFADATLSFNDYVTINRAIENRVKERYQETLPSYGESIRTVSQLMNEMPEDSIFKKYFAIEKSYSNPEGIFKLKEEYALKPLEDVEQKELEKELKVLFEKYPGLENNLAAIQLETYGQTLSTKSGGFLKYLPNLAKELVSYYNQTFEAFNNSNNIESIKNKLILNNPQAFPIVPKNKINVKDGTIYVLGLKEYEGANVIVAERKTGNGYSILFKNDDGIGYNPKNRIDFDENFKRVLKKEYQELIQKEIFSEIYSKLGDKTKSENIVIKSVYQQEGVKYAKSIDGIFSLRVNNSNKHFGNPFSSVPSEIAKGLIPVKSTREAVEKYIDWVINADKSKWTNHSGGAIGSDTEWDKIGSVFGMINNRHYWTETKTPKGNTEISKEDFEEGKYKSAKAAKRNFGYSYSTMKDSRLIRNWSQVKYSDAVFAIGKIVKTGEKIFPNQTNDTRVAKAPSVTGGTGYAVGMAINNSKPVFVFNQTKGSYDIGWYMWDNKTNDFIKTETPILTENFAGIGTREINDLGKAAIKEVYEKTNNNYERLEWIREQLKSGNLKGKPIIYYDELGEPSHATALDYLINKYNWSKDDTKEIKPQEKGVSSMGLITEDTNKYEAIKSALSEIFPNIKVFTDKEAFLEYINKHFNKDGEIDINKVGAAFGDAIYINENSATQDTLFHEHAHIYWDALPSDNPVKVRLLKLFNGNEEAVIQAIGEAGTDMLSVKLSGSKLAQFKGLLQLFWANIKNLFGKANANDLVKIFSNKMITHHGVIKVDTSGNVKFQAKKLSKEQQATKKILEDRQELTEFDEVNHSYKNKLSNNILNSVTSLIGLHKGFRFEEDVDNEKDEINQKLYNYAKNFLGGMDSQRALEEADLDPKNTTVQQQLKFKGKGAIAATLGTSVHKIVEGIINGLTPNQIQSDKDVSYLPQETFDELYAVSKEIAIKVQEEGAILPELRISSPTSYMAGSIDIPVILKNGKVKIYDIKTSEESTKSESYTKRKGTLESKKRKHGVQMAMYSQMISQTEPNIGPGIEVESYEIIPVRYSIKDNQITSVELEPNVTFTNAEILANHETAKEIISNNIKTSIPQEALSLLNKVMPEGQFFDKYYKDKNIDSNYNADRKKYQELALKKKQKNITNDELKELGKLFKRISNANEAYEDYKDEVAEIVEEFKDVDIEQLSLKELKEKMMKLSVYDVSASGLILPRLNKALAEKVEREFLDDIGRQLPDDFTETDIDWLKKTLGSYQKTLSNNPMAQAVVTRATDALKRANHKSFVSQDKLYRLANKLYKEKYGAGERFVKVLQRTFWKYDDADLYAYMFDKNGDMFASAQSNWTDTQKAFYEEVKYWQQKAKPVLQKHHEDYDPQYASRLYIAKAMPQFQEVWKNSNLFNAWVYKLGKQYTVEQINVKYKDPKTGVQSNKQYGAVVAELEKYYNQNLLTKVRALYLLRKYRLEAENYMRQENPRDAAGKMIKVSESYHTFAVDERGEVIMRPMSDPSGHVLDKDYGVLTQHFMRTSKTFKNTTNVLAATSQLIEDINYHEGMKDVMPEFLAVQSYYGQLGNFSNISKFLEEEFMFRLLKKKDTTLSPAVDGYVKAINWLATHNALGYNIKAATVNAAVGILNNMIDEPVKYLKTIAYMPAAALKYPAYPFMWAAQKLGLMKETDNPTYWGKINALAVNYQVYEPQKYRHNAHGTAFSLNPMVITQMVEYWNQVSLYAAKLPKELLDMYNQDGTFKSGLSLDQKNAARKQMQEIVDDIQNLHGRYKESEMRHIQFYTLGKSVTKFKLWMFEAIEYRFGKKGIDNRGKEIIGTHRAAGIATKYYTLKAAQKTAVALHLNETARNLEEIINRSGGKLSASEIKYAKSAAMEALLAGAMLMGVIAIKGGDDDDKDDAYTKWIKKQFVKLFGDFMFMYDGGNWKNLVSSPAPALGYLVKIFDAMASVVSIDEEGIGMERYKRDGKYGKGPSRKGANDGDLKVWGKVLTLTPWSSPIRTITDLEDEKPKSKKRKGAKIKFN